MTLKVENSVNPASLPLAVLIPVLFVAVLVMKTTTGGEADHCHRASCLCSTNQHAAELCHPESN